ncbi:MAG: hypothetical protein Q8P55_00720 [bacterium]|nr:hypothetical protein [bacterium]
MGQPKTPIIVFKIALVSIIIGTGVFGLIAQAVDFQSPSFILRDPVITTEGGRSISASFEYYSSTGQPTIGESTSGSFIHRAGFLYFEEVAPLPPITLGSLGPGTIPGAAAVFLGKAYPQSTVILLKDGQIAGTGHADGAGNFSLDIGGLSVGDYLFSLYGRDYTGKTSRLISFSVSVVFDTTTTIRDVVIPPTISVDKRQVAQGEIIDLFGQSVPRVAITIVVKTPTGQFPLETISDQQGRYRYSLDTSSLDFGNYSAVAEASLEGSFSNIASAAAFFIVGKETILEEPVVCPPKGDLNTDCFVNLVDFSILIYWFGTPNVSARVDLNGDGKADLVDFSIMAYYWTG